MSKNPKLQELTFQLIENSVIILSRDGAYSQHEAWSRRGEVFAKMGSTFVGLRRTGTSKNKVGVKDFNLGGQEEFRYTPTGRVVLLGHPDAGEEDARTMISQPLPTPEKEVGVTKKK